MDLKSEKACYPGKFISLEKSKLTINFLDPEAKWTGLMTFRQGDIRTIEYDTDYLNSLKLLGKIS